MVFSFEEIEDEVQEFDGEGKERLGRFRCDCEGRDDPVSLLSERRKEREIVSLSRKPTAKKREKERG